MIIYTRNIYGNVILNNRSQKAVGLDPDFRSQRTQTLGLTRVKGNSDFGSDQGPSLAQLLVQKTKIPKSRHGYEAKALAMLEAEATASQRFKSQSRSRSF